MLLKVAVMYRIFPGRGRKGNWLLQLVCTTFITLFALHLIYFLEESKSDDEETHLLRRLSANRESMFDQSSSED
jgi:hypothetical protein